MGVLNLAAMKPLSPTSFRAAWVCLVLIAGLAVSGMSAASSSARPVSRRGVASPSPLPGAVATCPKPGRCPTALSDGARGSYLKLAERGMTQQAGHWRTSRDGWYCEVLRCTGSYPLLTIWGVVRMFEAADAVQMADPSAAHRATVDRFARQSKQLYWNRYLRGYDPYPGDNYPAAQAWFDDNGWLGLAFVDAYRATGERRWVQDAQRAFDFVAAHGWRSGGGMWWNIQHQQLSGEALAANSLLGVLLHQITGNGSDLALARSWIDWANAHNTGFRGLYVSDGPGSSVSPTSRRRSSTPSTCSAKRSTTTATAVTPPRSLRRSRASTGCATNWHRCTTRSTFSG